MEDNEDYRIWIAEKRSEEKFGNSNKYNLARTIMRDYRQMIGVTLVALACTSVHEGVSLTKKFESIYAREQRVIQFYQRHGACPRDLNARQVSERANMWIREVEYD